MKLSLIIPAYNEEKRMPPFLDSIVAYCAERPDDIYEVLIIDDGSSDKTREVAETFTARLPRGQVIEHAVNQGKGAAVQTGVRHATGTVVVFIDADGATAIDQLPKMIEALRTHQIGVGSRWQEGAKADRSTVLRHVAGWVYKTYMSMFGLGGIDTMCGFKGYTKEVADDLFANLLDKRWLFDTEIAYKAVRRGYSIKNFPIEWHSVDGSKLSSFDLVKSAFGIWPLVRKIKKADG